MGTVSLKLRLFAALATAFVTACGSSGSSDESSEGALINEIKGSITSLGGDIAALNGWHAILMEKETRVCRVSEINSSGAFTFNQVKSGAVFTMLLLNPDFKVGSVFATPSSKVGKVHQYFKLKVNSLPRLVYKGSTFDITDHKKIEIQTDYAEDADSNGVPDGLDDATVDVELGVNRGFSLSDEDTDTDGSGNTKDPDLENDGIANNFDEDNDDDGTVDVFDDDSNDNLVNDISEKNGELYFDEGVEFISFQHIVDISATATDHYLKFTTKVRDDVSPSEVLVRGKDSLFSGALAEMLDGDEIVTKAWDRTLADDGKNDDGVENDKLYSRKVKLDTGKKPSGKQVFFIDLAFGSGSSRWYKEYAFTYPNVTVDSLEFTYDATTRKISIDGQKPFGGLDGYYWSAWVYNADGVVIFTSPAVSAKDRATYTIPSNILESGGKYSARVFAQSMDLFQDYGLPAIVVKSAVKSLE